MRNIIKHPFINLVFFAALFAFSGCTNEMEPDIAGNGNLPADGTRLTVRATASGFQTPAQDGGGIPSTRTPIMEGTSTKFQPGDAIGLFCVRHPASGADYIATDICNLKMTYTEAADGTGTWEAPTAESAPLVYTDAVTYFAYYPYTDALTTASVNNEQDIRNWLKTNKPLATDMLTVEALTANDLMTATALPSLADADAGTLALNFKHEYALLVVKPMAKGVYVAPAGVTAYSYHSATDVWVMDDNVILQGGVDYKMLINKKKACGMSDGSYRILVEPTTTSGSISCDYVTYNDGLLPVESSSSPFSSGFQSNTCYTLEVHCNGVENVTERALQPGDFIYEHNGKIEIYPGDGPVDADGKIPEYEKAVGIVVTCDPARMTDAKCNEQGWNHAYVIGVERLPSKSGAPMTWEGGGSVTPTSLPPVSDSAAKNYMNGYTDTQTMVDGKTPGEYSIFEAIVSYRNSHPVLTGIDRSPWFIPSIGQWVDVMINLCGVKDLEIDYAWSSTARELYEKVNTQFGKVGTDLLAAEYPDQLNLFWTSSEYSDETSFAWSFQGGINESECMMLLTPHHKNNFPGSNSRHCARPFFAF